MKAQAREKLLQAWKTRFEKNMQRHKGITWDQVRARLETSSAALTALGAMESTGGEPDVIGKLEKSVQFVFCDCSAQTPVGRTSLCYDADALESRKQHKPKGSAVEMAEAMSIQLISEEQYRRLQELGDFDTSTSSWVKTPPEIRALGGALFCDRRYGQVFVYHNGAQSYYASRGFRGVLHV